MYGFVEPWITRLLNCPYDAYSIGDGNMAHIVDVEHYNRIILTFREIHNRNHYETIEMPRNINSNVRGMHIILTRYWDNESILYGLTDGDIKRTNEFVCFMNMQTPRFNMNTISEQFIEIYNSLESGLRVPPGIHIHSGNSDEASIPDQVPEEPVVRDRTPEEARAQNAEAFARAIGSVELRSPQEPQEIRRYREVVNALGFPSDTFAGVNIGAISSGILSGITNSSGTAGFEWNTMPTEMNIDLADLQGTPPVTQLTPEAVPAQAEYAPTQEMLNEQPKNINEAIKDKATNTSAVPSNMAEGEQLAKKIEKEKEKINEIDVFLIKMSEILRRNGRSFNTKKSSEGYTVIVDASNIDFHISHLLILADKIKKNIIYALYYPVGFHRELKRNWDTKEIMKHTLFINPNIGGFQDEMMFTEQSEYYTSCLGCMVHQPYLVYGENVNTKIEALRKKDDEEGVKEIVNKKENSPYYKYDCVFKDTYTNVVWAVKDRCVLHLLVDCAKDTSGDRIFIAKEYEEIARRIDMKYSYNQLFEIDKKYFDSMNNSNMKDYTDFAIANSRKIYDDLVSNLEDHKKRFNDYMSHAMEEAKVVQRFEDQLMAFDMKKFEENERQKAMQTYQDTMAINKVKCVFVSDGIVHVYTKNIYVKDPRTNKWHDIGTFHILLGMLNKTYNPDSTIHVFNTKYSGMGMSNSFQAPHIYQDGHVCHGNMAASMVESYKQRNLFELIFQMIVFLGSVNIGDAAGVYINSWPEVSEETIKQDENIDNHAVYTQISETEKKFDNMLAGALPIHVSAIPIT